MFARDERLSGSKRRGVAAVEMALVLPLFFMVVFGIIEFGRAMMVSNMVTNSAREGCRLAILEGSTNTEVTDAITTFLTSSLGIPASKVNVAITITPAPTNPDPGGQLANANSRDVIAVDVSVAFNDVALIPGNYLSGRTLYGRSTMRHE